jgi:hypothetical protein
MISKQLWSFLLAAFSFSRTFSLSFFMFYCFF